MKTTLPLPTEAKQFPVSQEVVKQLDYPFNKAERFKVSFTQADINYINNTIKTHKLYRAVKQTINNNTDSQAIVRRCATVMNFFNIFCDDDKCPGNVKYFLGGYMGWLKYQVAANNQEKTLAQTQMFMERWMEICR